MSLRSTKQRRASSSSYMAGSDSTVNRPSRSQHPIPASNESVAVPGPATSSSFSHAHRPLARSFVSSSPIVLNDPARYSSTGVREETAELASFTFSKPPPSQASELSRLHFDHPHASDSSDDSSYQASSAPNIQRWTDNPTAQLPETIEESSEPVSPIETRTHSPPGQTGYDESLPDAGQKSTLSNMLKKFSNYGTTPDTRKQSEDANVKPPSKVPEMLVGGGDEADERTALMSKVGMSTLPQPPSRRLTREQKKSADGDVESQRNSKHKPNTFMKIFDEARGNGIHAVNVITNPKSWSARTVWERGVMEPVGLLPCVFLGLLLNVLDALSYGMILFPLGEPIFEKTGPDGISMFYLSCIISQLVFSSGGSIFKGAVGSEMIEVVPFFHKMTYVILARTGRSDPKVVLATTITAYAMSSVLTGLVFFLLGVFKLGSIVSFFPRHILVGCVGGVGFFLFVTGIEVSARLQGNLEYNLETATHLFRKDTVPLWTIPMALAVVLIIVQRFIRSSFFVPVYFISVVVVFYIVLAAVGSFNVQLGRENGWIFPAVDAGVPFYNFYSYYDFNAVDWKALAATIPSMFALTFFGVLHVPINIPALGIAAEEDDLNLNRELVAHGISNAISGFVGSIQNYLVYVNSAMFIENGGNNRIAGFLLAAATIGVWISGPGLIGYVPIMVVGALIFYLGIVLLEEALVDTWGKMSTLEYLTVLAIVLVMGIYDFVAGIVVGIALACLNFVVQTSRKSAIRATYSGEIVESTVRRHPIQRRFLHEVGYQIYVTKLAGFLFFGSIVRVEKQSRALIEEEAFNRDPIRFLIFDLANVNGLDYSAAEAFGRMERVLARRQVRMVISGVNKDSDVGKSLRNVGLWSEKSTVQYFETLNGALELCENELLKAFYRHRDALDDPETLDSDTSKLEATLPLAVQAGGLESQQLMMAVSPRQRYLDEAATTTLSSHARPAPKRYSTLKQPLPLILQTFSEVSDKREDFWFHALPYFSRQEYIHGTVLFSLGQPPDAFYILESGMLIAHYTLPMGSYHESIVAGTTCGELPFFSDTARTATVSAERDCVVWRMGREEWERMRKEWTEGAQEVLQCAMKLTKERVDAVVSYVLTTAG